MTSYEIERRWLVRVDDAAWGRLGGGMDFRQGYVRNGTPSVRIRTGEPRGPVLTCKSGSGVKRREAESVVNEEIAEALFLAAESRVVEKTRYRIPPGWELDRFKGPLEGLALLEMELKHEDDEVPRPPKGIKVLREVTDDNRFTNGTLARLSKKKQKAFVKKAYKEAEAE